ncbi:transmembrane protein 81 [Brachyhypopomus gauderio]|uniref:transmembrane protein 81 n=1 Tax=Brachyhypopomus gauderio TaxID=698409 RepID=UPI00404253C4
MELRVVALSSAAFPSMSTWAVLSAVLFCVVMSSPSPRDPSAGVDLEDLASAYSWVIVRSSPCSATCGLGLRTQELCPAGPAQANNTACRVRRVQCLQSWQCGLRTQTVIVGQRLELDCLEEVVEAMGRFAFIVSWRFARGIVTTDNRLFTHYDVPGLDRVVLDPVREEHAGTYLCDVQDTSYHKVKRMYKGVKVLSSRVLSLDFNKSLIQWEKPGNLWPNITLVTGKLYPGNTVQNMVLVSLTIAMAIAMIIFLALFTLSHCSHLPISV